MLNADELPSWFAYPPEHKFLLEMGIRNLQTWVIVTESRQEKALLSCVMEKSPKTKPGAVCHED